MINSSLFVDSRVSASYVCPRAMVGRRAKGSEELVVSKDPLEPFLRICWRKNFISSGGRPQE